MRLDAHLVLWDGDCGFCGRAIAWLQRNDRQHCFQFVRYQEAPSPPMTPELYRACGEAVHVIDRQGSIRRGGRAMLFILEQEGWGQSRGSYPFRRLSGLSSSYIGSSPRTGPGLVDFSFARCLDSGRLPGPISLKSSIGQQ
jgi:hypothetical protein